MTGRSCWRTCPRAVTPWRRGTNASARRAGPSRFLPEATPPSNSSFRWSSREARSGLPAPAATRRPHAAGHLWRHRRRAVGDVPDAGRRDPRPRHARCGRAPRCLAARVCRHRAPASGRRAPAGRIAGREPDAEGRARHLSVRVAPGRRRAVTGAARDGAARGGSPGRARDCRRGGRGGRARQDPGQRRHAPRGLDERHGQRRVGRRRDHRAARRQFPDRHRAARLGRRVHWPAARRDRARRQLRERSRRGLQSPDGSRRGRARRGLDARSGPPPGD